MPYIFSGNKKKKGSLLHLSRIISDGDELKVRLCVYEIMDFRMCIASVQKEQDYSSNEIKTILEVLKVSGGNLTFTFKAS